MLPKFLPAKLLITITGSHHAEQVIEAAKMAGAGGGTKAAGRGYASYRTSGGLEVPDAPEELVFILMNDAAQSIIHGVVQAAARDPKNLNGMALVIDVPAMLGGRYNGAVSTEYAQDTRSEPMESGTMLITGIINHGEADGIMAVARKAGARGGTILNARGTGTEDDVKFFGISLAPEKEMLFIVADADHGPSIMNALSQLSLFNEPGGGIIYATKVEQFFILGS